MLNLDRYLGQRIRIGDDIVVVVTGVDKQTGRVRLSIEAPREIAVHREEIYKRIQAEKAGLAPSPDLNTHYLREDLR